MAKTLMYNSTIILLNDIFETQIRRNNLFI